MILIYEQQKMINELITRLAEEKNTLLKRMVNTCFRQRNRQTPSSSNVLDHRYEHQVFSDRPTCTTLYVYRLSSSSVGDYVFDYLRI